MPPNTLQIQAVNRVDTPVRTKNRYLHRNCIFLQFVGIQHSPMGWLLDGSMALMMLLLDFLLQSFDSPVKIANPIGLDRLYSVHFQLGIPVLLGTSNIWK